MKILSPNLVLESARRRGFRGTATNGSHKAKGVRGHAPPPPLEFFFGEGFRWLLKISKGTFQALKQLIFH